MDKKLVLRMRTGAPPHQSNIGSISLGCNTLGYFRGVIDEDTQHTIYELEVNYVSAVEILDSLQYHFPNLITDTIKKKRGEIPKFNMTQQ